VRRIIAPVRTRIAFTRRAGAATLALALYAALLVALAAPAAAQPRPPLGHAGRWITDASGRVVILHGVNMVYKVPPYAPDAIGFGDDDGTFLQRNGFNSVRLGILHVAVEPNPGSYDDGYLARIASTVQTLGQHRVFSLLDFHQDLYNERFQGEGEPAWSVEEEGLPNPENGFPGNYLTNPALNRAFDHFWQNSAGPGGPGLQDRYAAAWGHVATAFRGNQYVMGDDVFNEPWPGSQWPTCANPEGCPAFDQAFLAPFMHRVIAAIHAADPRVVAYYEPNVFFDFGADTSIGDPGDSRSGMSFHDYCVAGLVPESSLGAGMGCDPAEQLVFQHADAQSRRTGDALLMTEFGATDNLTDIQRIVNDSDAHMVGWEYWAYTGQGDVTGAPQSEPLVNDPRRQPGGPNVRVQKLAVLARPFPQAVAGTPTAFSYDSGANVFKLSYTTARAAGGGSFPAGSETDVFVPTLHYPHDYSVQVSGAAAVSSPGARILRLRSCSGRTRVNVRVAPAGVPSSDCEPPESEP
jgi:endoglycosylceramidase